MNADGKFATTNGLKTGAPRLSAGTMYFYSLTFQPLEQAIDLGAMPYNAYVKNTNARSWGGVKGDPSQAAGICAPDGYNQGVAKIVKVGSGAVSWCLRDLY